MEEHKQNSSTPTYSDNSKDDETNKDVQKLNNAEDIMDSPFKINEYMDDHLGIDKYFKKDPKNAL